MKLPDTQNAHHLYAFKKGYRLALDGKTVNQAASKIRYDQTMRQYCLMGWEQANEEMAAGIKEMQKTPWRNRLAWFVMMVLGGIATASVLINSINEKKVEQQALIANEAPAISAQQIQNEQLTTPTYKTEEENRTVAQTPATDPTDNQAQTNEITVTSAKETESGVPQTTIASPAESVENDLSILTPQQREDLTLTKQEQQESIRVTVEPSPVVQQSKILVVNPALTTNIIDKEPTETFNAHVPKNIRKLFFFTPIKGAEGNVIYHRWLHKQKVMALIPLTINSNLYRTWSSKRLTSAWQGEWTVEVLDSKKQVLYRHSFTYGNL
ncbi:DUF2914 domain-containing protein [Thiomicrorhabdus sp. ZW0627]|uniref:DUF2914 domain-containing protein n=1 Tax=Thiomicrorhabdus sp. ZW0627 TaxID=3039774 RepID=UPI002436F84B|nr:DUF2914 domain-containing protein [Thiomicrorhabdus sp. ZW0627]MDG6773930.1 DUF2914 domain-containing protein [Thiomicrorhabdus sp. ZW0627]